MKWEGKKELSGKGKRDEVERENGIKWDGNMGYDRTSKYR